MEKENNPYNYSASTLKALARFGPGNASSINPKNKPEPLPLPGTDWELWAHMPTATLADAVAVSLGIDPSAIKPRSGYVEPGKDFERRLKLACAFVSHTGPLKSLDALPPNHLFYGPATATVSLPQFAAWALSMGWELPNKFPRLKAAPRQAMTPSPAPVVKEATEQPAPAQKTAAPAPEVAANASGGVKPDKAGPLPLTTGDIAFCFAGLRWKTETEWKKPLGDKPKWLSACIVIPGVRGVRETRWSPVCIGAALVRAGHAKLHSVRAKFQTQPLLRPWLDEWKTYEADNSDSN